MSIRDILKNAAGEFEVGRTLLVSAGFFGIFAPIGFEVYEVRWNGGHFDVAAWCLAYPGGLAALVTAGVLSIGVKSKADAAARQTDAVTQMGKQQ
jgi:hypothetical protein